MTIYELNYILNKGTGREVQYFVSEIGSVQNMSIKNKGDIRVHILSVGIQFDWQTDNGTWYSNLYSIELDPGGEKDISEDFNFMIAIEVDEFVDGKWTAGGSVLFPLQHILIKEHPRREYMVFISHSNHQEDEELTTMAHDLLKCCGMDAYVAERKGEPGEWLWSKLERKIRISDSFLVLWTKQGATSGDVREEIGIAIGANKYEQIVPVVEKGEDLKGSLKGKEWAPLDRERPEEGLIEAIDKIKEAEKRPPITMPSRF
jgi:hypothetical protein